MWNGQGWYSKNLIQRPNKTNPAGHQKRINFWSILLLCNLFLSWNMTFASTQAKLSPSTVHYGPKCTSDGYHHSCLCRKILDCTGYIRPLFNFSYSIEQGINPCKVFLFKLSNCPVSDNWTASRSKSVRIFLSLRVTKGFHLLSFSHGFFSL